MAEKRAITRIQDADDFSDSLTANEYVQYDGSNFVLTAVGVADTKTNILARTGDPTPTLAYATDTEELYAWDGSEWFLVSLVGKALSVLDMGYQQGALHGYAEDYVTDKTLNNCLILGNARTENGGIRVDVTQDPDTFEVYLRNVWQTLIYDLTTEDGDFRHVPIAEEIYIWRGDSVATGVNGQPIVSEYQTSMGANPPRRILDGGSF